MTDAVSIETTGQKRRYGLAGIAVAILFGLFYVYDLFEAISNVAALPAQIELGNKLLRSLDQPTLPVPWVLLIVNLLLAPVVYGLAYWLGRRASTGAKAAYFLIGLTVVAALTLTVEFLVSAS